MRGLEAGNRRLSTRALGRGGAVSETHRGGSRGRFASLALVTLVLLALGGAGAASPASAARANVLVLSRANNGEEGRNAAAILTSLGYTVTTTETLPADLSPYSSVWSVLAYEGLSPEEQEHVERYVQAGGKIYLTGERPCCEALNVSDEAVMRAVLKDQAIVIGQQGDLSGPFSFNPNARDGIAQLPNLLSEFPVDAPGGLVGIGNIGEPNILGSNGSVAVGGVFDESDMANGKGRAVVDMDIDWLRESSHATREAVIQNIEDFLEKTPHRLPKNSAEYVALGDSYASGQGSFSYFVNAKNSPAPCYRATDGYVEQIAAQQQMSLKFAACSGATIGDIATGTAAQIKNVRANTRLVTLSVGGNDVGFSDVLDDCIGGVGSKGGTGCGSREEAAAQTAIGWLEHGREPGTYTLPGIKSPRNATAPTSTNTTRLPSLAELYEEIVRSANPTAHLVVVGYPELFETTTSPVERCQVGTVLGLDKLNVAAEDVEWLDARTAQLDKVIAQAVSRAAANTGADITFVDPRPGFLGGVVCDERDEYINPLLFKALTWQLEPESFHPTEAGQDILAREILGEL